MTLTGRFWTWKNSWQFPFAWGAIDGCHIPVKCPPSGLQACKKYHNFKNFYSIVLMAIVDSNYRSLWGSCGFPGNSHDSVIFQSTDFWTKIKEKDFIPNIGQQVGDVSVPSLLLGDSAFSALADEAIHKCGINTRGTLF